MKRMLSLPIAIAIVSLAGMAMQVQGAAGSESKSGSEMKSKTVNLFNGKDLDGWKIQLKDPDADPKQVFEVRDGAIWCKGEPFGYIRTKKKFGDFKLTVEWKWPEEPSNSGVFLRMQDEDKIWPLCMEAQLYHEHAGDVIGMGVDFNEDESEEGEYYRYAEKMHETNEKEPGEWNKYEITCKGDTIELRVNGQLQNKATGVDLREGYIGLQSEGGPIMFRNVKVTPLK